MYQLFTDTDTDVTPKIAEKLGYKLIIMPYTLSNGTEVHPYIDYETFDYVSFYQMLRKGEIPKTFALAPTKYIEYFEPTLKEGKDILYVHFSAAMSGTFDSMKIAWEELSKRYPDRKLYTVDTKGISILSHIIIEEIATLANGGATADEILDWANREVDKFAVYFYSNNLKFFARSGRISNFSAAMGSLIGIRPIISVDDKGVMSSIGKAKGKSGAIDALLNYVKTLQDDIKGHKVLIGHTDALDQAQTLEGLLKKEFGDDLVVEIMPVNPTIGCHCGPETVGVCFHAIHR
ncbi:MAG: DegV family protein [Clostridia bacterium]|nr:DegV family protein [Clostridia bacterium]